MKFLQTGINHDSFSLVAIEYISSRKLHHVRIRRRRCADHRSCSTHTLKTNPYAVPFAADVLEVTAVWAAPGSQCRLGFPDHH